MSLPSRLPKEEDAKQGHNAIHDALRSSDVDVLTRLLNTRPIDNDYLDETLSKSYEELKLMKVPLSNEIQFFVESKLFEIRFFVNPCDTSKNPTNIQERIKLVIEQINFLSTISAVNNTFLFVTKCIAQNIHILKRQMKSTYDKIPWEEIEFCLIIFVSSHTNLQEHYLFGRAKLNKSKLLNYLKHFVKLLRIDDLTVNNKLPSLKRDQILDSIVKDCPQFAELYNDYHQIRDGHSLQKISDYLNLALSVDPKGRDGELVMFRTLQIVGEYFKNTLESPNLSTTTSDLLLLSVPTDTRRIIIHLRNSLSHAYSFSKRLDIEKNKHFRFFVDIQNELKQLNAVISKILGSYKTEMIRILLKKVIDSKNEAEIKEASEICSNINIFNHRNLLSNINVLDFEELERLIKKLDNNVVDKTAHEMQLFNDVYYTIQADRTKLKDDILNFPVCLAFITKLSYFCKHNVDHNTIRTLKYEANNLLKNFTSSNKVSVFNKIREMVSQILESIWSREQTDVILSCISEVCFILMEKIGDFTWLRTLREKISGDNIRPTTNAKNVQEKPENTKALSVRLSELKKILETQIGSTLTDTKFVHYKFNKKLQAAVELLLLDLLSMMKYPNKYLDNNLIFLDSTIPILSGKCLRNHLAHDNDLIYLLESNPKLAVILNAKKLIDENIFSDNKNSGTLFSRDIIFQEKYKRGLKVIINMEKMFLALEEGHLEDFKECLKMGADIKGKNTNLWTTLHYAAKGGNLTIIKYILSHNIDGDLKDIKGQSPLHIAATYGRANIIKYFIEKTKALIDDRDNMGRTPLHIAAQNGHTDIVDFLLKCKANPLTKDIFEYSPLASATRNNYIDIVKILVKGRNVDDPIFGGFTLLHIAAEGGNLQLVNFLLHENANVNARTDKISTPLHVAALNGHLEVAKALVANGADINPTSIDGCTPLHYAIENGYKDILNILLEHGANVNVADKTYHNTPLHYAAADGHDEIVTILLKNKANSDAEDVSGMTALHLAIVKGHMKVINSLIAHGDNFHLKIKDNMTALHLAVAGGHTQIAEFLIKRGLNVNARTTKNETPLFIAALNGHEDLITLLLENKADVNAKNHEGYTPLHIAVQKSNTVVHILIENKANVNNKTKLGLTPLHIATEYKQSNIIDLLIKNGAEVNAGDSFDNTSLHLASHDGSTEILKTLLKHKAEINSESKMGTPLYLASSTGHLECVKILIANGANVNKLYNNETALIASIKYCHKNIMLFLIENGASINMDGIEPLSAAAYSGDKDLVKILLQKKAKIDGYSGIITPLHVATKRDFVDIVKILIENGANVNANIMATPLYLAAAEGHAEVAKVLIANGARVNVKDFEGFTPLNIAASNGHIEIVNILLDNNADVKIKDNKNRTPLELAVARGHLEVVKILLRRNKINMNAKCFNNWTILHIASQENSLEMVKYLVANGCNVHARNDAGSKPIHIASREGHKHIVEFFLNSGLCINERGVFNKTPLHYAVLENREEVVTCLIKLGADINAKDFNNETPMHLATKLGYENIVKLLLVHGANCNATDSSGKIPQNVNNDKNTVNVLESTQYLVKAIKHNDILKVKAYIKSGAILNAKISDKTSLHYAAWKGNEEILHILLQNEVDPNIVDNQDCTALHFAAKFSHFKSVISLLTHGAKYNAKSMTGKTPLDFSKSESINTLLQLLDTSFKKVKNLNTGVVGELYRLKHVDTVKAIMRARNTENKTLIVVAIQCKFPHIDELKQILQRDVKLQISEALNYLNKNNYIKALSIFKKAFEKRKEILGPDNPGTLDLETYIGIALYKEGKYEKAINILNEIYQKQEKCLGENSQDSLYTRSAIALVLHRQEKNEEALYIFEQVFLKQKEILDENHEHIFSTQIHMALVLNKLERYEEALAINQIIYKKRKMLLGPYSTETLSAQNNIAMVLANCNQCDKAIKIFNEVLEKKKMILGVKHADTLNTMQNIVNVLMTQEKYSEALKYQMEVLDIRKNELGPNHPNTLISQYNLGNIHFIQRNWISALREYSQCYDKMKIFCGLNHTGVIDITVKMKFLNTIFRMQASDLSEMLQRLQNNDVNIAGSNGDVEWLKN